MREQVTEIGHVVREETLFAGWRQPIKSRDELPSKIEEVSARSVKV